MADDIFAGVFWLYWGILVLFYYADVYATHFVKFDSVGGSDV